MVAVIVVVVFVIVMGASLLAPVPKRWDRWVTLMAFWRRRSVRQRWHERRPLRRVYLGLVAVATVGLVIWVLPDLLISSPQLGTAAEQHKAIADTRTGLVAMLVALGAAGGLAFTAQTYRLSREGHITDRYSKAVEQLGSDKIAVRLGGIYALARLMRDSPADQPTIMETLAAYVREHAPVTPPTTTRARDRRVAGQTRARSTPASNHPAEDVQAVLTVLGSRQPLDDEGPINLQHTNLTGAQLSRANLTGARLKGANLAGAQLHWAMLNSAQLDQATLTGALLYRTTLAGAQLNGATLTGARLIRANLIAAHLDRANLTGADLNGANLAGAWLNWATLTDTRLNGATLTGAWLDGVNLTGAGLIGATLAGAKLVGANLTGAQLRHGTLGADQLAVAFGVDEIVWE